jgi:hypothetical protein
LKHPQCTKVPRDSRDCFCTPSSATVPSPPTDRSIANSFHSPRVRACSNCFV